MFGGGPSSCAVGDPTEFRKALLGDGDARLETPLHNAKTNGKARRNGAAKPLAANEPAVGDVIHHVPVDRIDPSPFQPRGDFPEADIRSLADSISEHGLQVPITVRPIGDRFELIFGERRLRAVKLAGQTLIRAQVRQRSDCEVRQLILVEVLQRKDLNAIEEAKAFKQSIDAGDAAGPTELAKQLGLSQGHVSNRLRLLELPAKVQAKVISREMSATNARALVPYAHVPAIVEYVLKDTANRGADCTTEEFEDAIGSALWNACKEIHTQKWYDSKHRCEIPPMKLSDQQRTELAIVVEQPRYKGGKPTEHATNVKLYEKLWNAHAAEAIERAKKKGTEERGEGRGKSPKQANKTKPLTEAQRKKRAEEEARKAKERAQYVARHDWHTAINWRRALIARACATSQVSLEDIMRLLLLLGASAAAFRRGGYIANQEINNRENILGNVTAAKRKSGDPALWAALAATEDRDLTESAFSYLGKLFWNPGEGGEATIEDEDVLAIAEQLTIDLSAAWKKEAAGDLTRDWLEYRTKAELLDLVKQWKCDHSHVHQEKKEELVDQCLKVAKTVKLPQVLLSPKRPKG
ncbi:MAG: ParB/RepB/Spo0J family partition protein [Patescibacteria group bacterium]